VPTPDPIDKGACTLATQKTEKNEEKVEAMTNIYP